MTKTNFTLKVSFIKPDGNQETLLRFGNDTIFLQDYASKIRKIVEENHGIFCWSMVTPIDQELSMEYNESTTWH